MFSPSRSQSIQSASVVDCLPRDSRLRFTCSSSGFTCLVIPTVNRSKGGKLYQFFVCAGKSSFMRCPATEVQSIRRPSNSNTGLKRDKVSLSLQVPLDSTLAISFATLGFSATLSHVAIIPRCSRLSATAPAHIWWWLACQRNRTLIIRKEKSKLDKGHVNEKMMITQQMSATVTCQTHTVIRK
ncbi:hypothetical protein TvY486_0045810 [Trypanosoma vivax Y486]|uniref:Uncharacterized protein n=1 Tax=Trypanosoma vivax (strain Y486) TaxID=1055687 RepID=F9WVQ2_TRYVY|nr:hypothetical protein TvY486_0045810 [Trypanosoma vivax Y486]|eukprot:CCD21660.1 hypothetical protein TvY486_0045810 [Trypanosoma vivax Y486]